MKSGAGDDPFAGESASEEDPDPENRDPAPDHEEPTDGTTRSLPYKYRRDSVKDGRTQRPVFLQSSTETMIEETIDDVEDQFDEPVYKTDVVEAMVVAGGEGTTPETVLQRWGYGMKNR
jgi:hypothetical protein